MNSYSLSMFINGIMAIKSRRVKRQREKREAARAAENKAFDKIMRERIAWERLMNEPVGVHMPITEKKPLRKATGLFSDAEAQRIIA